MLEATIQARFRSYLKAAGWHTERTHGNRYAKGWPDIYCLHVDHGQRWVDLKRPGKNRLTKAQLLTWPVWESYGVGVWIVESPDAAGYARLFEPANWRDYRRPGADLQTTTDELERIIDDLQKKYTRNRGC
jgi:hypothetical protein